MEETEIWKEIEGYEGIYSVSNFGRVKRHAGYTFNPVIKGNSQFRTERIKQVKKANYWGYVDVGLFNGEKKSHFKVHRLVALAFIPNPENKPQVNHIDGNKMNNHVSNLEWATSKENIQHSYRIGHSKVKCYGENHIQSKLKVKDALCIKLIYNGGLCTEKEVAKLFGMNSPSLVGQIARGYKWNKAIQEFINAKTA